MTETKTGETKKSDAPMILGIFGFIFSIPGTLCSGACAGCASLGMVGARNGSDFAGASTVFFLFLLPAVVSITAFIFSFMTKKNPKKAGVILIVCSIILLIISVVSFNWFFGLITTGCYLIAGVLSVKSANR